MYGISMITFKILFNSEKENKDFQNSISPNIDFFSSFDFKEIYIYSKLDFYIHLSEQNKFQIEKLQTRSIKNLPIEYLENHIRNISTFEEILNFHNHFENNIESILSLNDYIEIAYFNTLLYVFKKSFDEDKVNFLINNDYILNLITMSNYSYDFISIFIEYSDIENIDFILNKIDIKYINEEHLKLVHFLFKNNKVDFINKYINYKKDKNQLADNLFLLPYYKENYFEIFIPIFDYFINNYSFNKISFRRKLFIFFHTFFKDSKIYNYFKSFLFSNQLYIYFKNSVSDGYIDTFNDFHLDYFNSIPNEFDFYIEFFKYDIIYTIDVRYLIKMVEQKKDLDYDPIIISRIEEYKVNQILKNF